MTSVRFHCIEAHWSSFRGTECTQLACNEDGVIENDLLLICKAYVACYNAEKISFETLIYCAKKRMKRSCQCIKIGISPKLLGYLFSDVTISRVLRVSSFIFGKYTTEGQV